MNTEKKDNKKVVLIAFIVILVLLNAVLVYLIIKNKNEGNTKDKTIAQKEAQIKSASAKVDSIQQALDTKIEEFKQLGQDYEGLTKIKEQLESDKENLIRMADGSSKEYKEKIRAYEELLIAKDEELEKLRSINETLYSENNKIKTEKSQLMDSIGSINRSKEKLAEKVTMASVLKAENIKINALSDGAKEREGGKYKAKQIEKLKISFNLADNKIAKIESKEIYVRLIEPSGTILVDPRGGSGTFNADGKEVYYSAKQQVLFDNTQQNVTFLYNKGGSYKEGTHTVELYCEGVKIGTGSFVVR